MRQDYRMHLPVMPPLAPMLAKPITGGLPANMHVEPKWDGFRTIVFRDGDEIELGSRNEKPLTRYFPELVETLREQLPPRCVVDGEIIVIQGGRLEFELLQQRIHPAASRILKLATEIPAAFIAFDLLALGDDDLTTRPFVERRTALEHALGGASDPVFVTPATSDPDTAARWFVDFEGAGLDGLIAKPRDLPYQPDKRVQFKIKHERTADCVLAGYRMHKAGGMVGSLLLGLYGDDGHLHHVGVAASFTTAKRVALVDELEPLRVTDAPGLASHPWGDWATPAAHETTRMPGAVSRWSGGKDLSFVPLRPERVVEVLFDQMEGDRFRHTAQFKRWRTDRAPQSCTYEQLDIPAPFPLSAILPLR